MYEREGREGFNSYRNCQSWYSSANIENPDPDPDPDPDSINALSLRRHYLTEEDCRR